MSISSAARSVVEIGIEYGQFCITESLWNSICAIGEDVPNFESNALVLDDDAWPSEVLLHGKLLRKGPALMTSEETISYVANIWGDTVKKRDQNECPFRPLKTDSIAPLSTMKRSSTDACVSSISPLRDPQTVASMGSTRPSDSFALPTGTWNPQASLSSLPPLSSNTLVLESRPSQLFSRSLQPITSGPIPWTLSLQTQQIHYESTYMRHPTETIHPNHSQYANPGSQGGSSSAQATFRDRRERELAGKQVLLLVARNTRSVSKRTREQAEREVLVRDLESFTTWCQQHGICLSPISIHQGIPQAR